MVRPARSFPCVNAESPCAASRGGSYWLVRDGDHFRLGGLMVMNVESNEGTLDVKQDPAQAREAIMRAMFKGVGLIPTLECSLRRAEALPSTLEARITSSEGAGP